MKATKYGFGVTLGGLSVEEAVAKVTEALGAVGFGILTRIDVDKTVKEKLGEDLRPYVILGACNPTLALDALRVEDHIGLLMPCNVLVQGREGGAEVSIIDAQSLVPLIESDGGATEAMLKADDLLRQAVASLGA